MIPVPDLSEDSEDFSDTCNAVDVAPQECSCSIYNHTFSAKITRVHQSVPRFKLFSLAESCDPDTSFLYTTPTGIEFDKDHPIYKTKSCTLYLGRYLDDYFALKTSHISNILIHEWENYKLIGKYPTIINAINFIKEQSLTSMYSPITYYIQLEYAFGGSISNYLNFIDYNEAWKILAHISSALNHIHNKGFIHLDISPSNILQCYLDKTVESPKNPENNFDQGDEEFIETVTVYKLADFGTVLKEGCFNNYCEGAGPYVSPEAIKWPHSETPVTSKTDIWSLGAVMFEIVTHKRMPRDPERYEAIRAGNLDLSSLIPEEFDFINDMLSVDPSKRPTTEDIMQIPKVKELIQSLENDLAFEILKDKSDEDDSKDNLKQDHHKSIKWEISSPKKIARRQSFDMI